MRKRTNHSASASSTPLHLSLDTTRSVPPQADQVSVLSGSTKRPDPRVARGWLSLPHGGARQAATRPVSQIPVWRSICLESVRNRRCEIRMLDIA